MSFNMKQMLQIVLEGQDKKISTDEVCRKYGINRQTYYRLRRELTRTALDLLRRHLENNGENYYQLYRENELLQRKVQRLTREKAQWEFKYKWLYWQLNSESNNEGCELESRVNQKV